MPLEHDRLPEHAVMDGHLEGGESAVQLMTPLEHGPFQYAVMDGHLAGVESPVQLTTLSELDRLQYAVMDSHLAVGGWEVQRMMPRGHGLPGNSSQSPVAGTFME